MMARATHGVLKRRVIAAGVALLIVAAFGAPATALAEDALAPDSGDGVAGMIAASAADSTQPMHRLYNPNSGEHFYTASANERDGLVRAGWRYEGIGWTAPPTSKTPVYRLYSGTDHHYTTSAKEKDGLVKAGWRYEGIGWYSDDAKGTPLYRQFNPNVNPKARRNNSGSHNYTTSKGENDKLVKLGWKEEGVGWYGVKNGDSSFNDISGWYQSVGSSGMNYHHLVDGYDYQYVRDLSDYSKFTYRNKYAITVEVFKPGDYTQGGLGSESGYRVKIGSAYYFERTSNKGMLESRKHDGSGYSGSSSIGRITNVPATLLALAKNTEG